MNSLLQQTARCILSRNFNLLRTVVLPARNFSAVSSCAPAVFARVHHQTSQIQNQFQSLQFSSLNIKDIETRVLKVIADYDKVTADKLTINSHFIQDLGLDSLDHVELIMAIEDEFGFEIPDNEAEKLAKPSDIVKFLSEKEDLKA